MTKLTVKANYNVQDHFTDEVFKNYHQVTFEATGKTHEEAVDNAYNRFDAIACEIERDTGFDVFGNYHYTEQTL